MYRIMKGYILIIFSPFRIMGTPSKLEVKTNIRVNLYISEKICVIPVTLIIGSLGFRYSLHSFSSPFFSSGIPRILSLPG